ncbi:YHS domain-containing (seleno)protein [Bradyrhizobium sp. CB1015]|uniref:YHS domain-containing (seleno)protein n=1 Tax=Bradyrhizobium sp. CB1015 TaxID=2976822 RepID=UPI0021A9FE90|nr:YHS domain-containing (seleno)protein [Bradyrhizobium sp. CB1015]UWU94258.1 YHS domain-containing protein [Bradyrhizobium sp. CB1015]
MIRRRASFAFSLVGLLIATSIAMAQSVQPTSLRLVLKGYDPVAYFMDGKPTPGKPEYEAVYDEARYRFASAQHLELFKADPDRYAPQYAGSCAAAVAAGVKIEADPEHWLIVDGQLFVFAGAAGVGKMRADPAAMIAKGRENWRALADAPYR